MVECPNKEENAEQCTCGAEDCERRGVCCECVRAHRAKGNLPTCLRKMMEEAGA